MENEKFERREKAPKVLSENRQRALAELLTPAKREDEPSDAYEERKMQTVENEKLYFLLYLNYAVNNIKQLTGLRKDNENEVCGELEKLGDQAIVKAAHFLFLFNIEEPGRDFKDYRQLTLMLVKKIFALRNLFAHPDGSGIVPLLDSRDFYVLLEGILLSHARKAVDDEGLRMDKIFKLKLMNKHLHIPETDLLYEKSKAYELTRKGMIFLVCMGLYKDEAHEFCSLFADMRLPERCPGGIDPEECDSPNCKESAPVCNIAKAKALIAMFTHFSCRKGRELLSNEETDFVCFADIVGYLNKVPAPAMDYLTLKKENERMAEAEAASERNAKHRESQYKLHKRFRERFLSFAAGYCEDFGYLPTLRFKRQDISVDAGRRQYVFGSENDNSVRMSRHYAIVHDAIGFEFIPEEHYGPVHIKALRSSISESELKKLLYLGLSEENGNNRSQKFSLIDERVKAYFTAYHRILETMLNTDADALAGYEPDAQMFEDLCTVSGSTVDALCESGEQFMKILAPFFPENLVRFFTDFDNRPGAGELHKALLDRLTAMQNGAIDFLNRIRKFKEWKRTPAEERKTPFPPDCTAEEVHSVPRSSRFHDGDLVARVFDLLNLYLTPEEKFRQLPRGEQHRGIKDHEYQLFHAAIGKYSLDQKGFESLFKKQREELYNAIWPQLDRKVMPLLAEEQRYIRENHICDKKGNLKRASKTLLMLAEAAVRLYIDYCDKAIDRWESCRPESVDTVELHRECRRFGVKTGMPLDRNSLIKTILRVDEAEWARAYDYEKGTARREKRQLESVEHIVSQVPFPNGFADRSLKRKKNMPCLADGSSDFSRAMAQLQIPVVLRDYYDVRPLIEFRRSKATEGVNRESYADFSRAAVDKARREIKKAEYQDKLLLLMALDYRRRFMESKGDSFQQEVADKADVYDYFETPISCVRKTDAGRFKVKVRPNDLTRPHFAQVVYKGNLPIIASRVAPEPGTEDVYDFFELQKALRIIQAEDRVKRLAILPALARFEARVRLPGSLVYEGKSEKERRDMEFPYYRSVFASLTREQFEVLVEARNAVFHDALAIETQEAAELLAKLFSSRR